MTGVYAIRNLVDGKLYIGSSADVRVRWRNHTSELRRGVHHNRYLQRAWDKHGESAFAFDMIETTAPADLVEREKHWLAHVRPFGDRGYNSYDAPTFGHYFRTEETRQKHREFMSGRKRGPQPEEVRRRRAEALRGHFVSDEARRKIGEAHRKIWASRTQEERERLREAARASHPPMDSCKRGHMMDNPYVLHRGDGRVIRLCRTCARNRKAAHRAKPEVKAREAAYMAAWRQRAKAG